MRVHFIAIGGAAMHNLALALQQNGLSVTGSDDEINEPSRSRLQAAGLLPEENGWFPERITKSVDAVILGMHARADNPELQRAQELGIPVYSYPEFLYEQSRNKKRVVIGGSHGKTTITAMVLHVLRAAGVDFDFMVGSQLKGFDTMVRLSSDAPVIVLEGDEYLASPIDRRPKFHLYKADTAVISGIAWDHINVFPTFDSYLEQFRIFANGIPRQGCLIFCREDEQVQAVCADAGPVERKIPYGLPHYEIRNGITWLLTDHGEIPLQVFGKHNLMNLEAARHVCEDIGVGPAEFYTAISSFAGAARRLEPVLRNENRAVFRDFAHSPSKVKATTEAVREQYAGWNLVACLELHTFSSLTPEFLNEYAGSMDQADHALVYFNPATLQHKRLAPISIDQVREAFARESIQVFNNPEHLTAELQKHNQLQTVLLMMSSGTFDGVKLDAL
jgi:UDP-N-acetylmuramate: L-alanyl-gamma-D-glutamyl-meso-diaminopimelate ligase